MNMYIFYFMKNAHLREEENINLECQKHPSRVLKSQKLYDKLKVKKNKTNICLIEMCSFLIK